MGDNNMSIKNEIKFALYAIKKNIESSAELRTSFLMNIFGMAINNIAFILLWMFFAKSTGSIGGWTPMDIIGMQGFLAISYGIVLVVANGIRKVADYTASGAFDRFMLSPKNLLIRIATSGMNVSAIGDLLFGIVCVTIYSIAIHVGLLQVFLIFILIVISTISFLSTMIAIYSTSFFFIDANTVTTGIFELYFTPALFDGGAFQGIMRFIFTFIIPSLLIGALPVEILKNISFDKLLLTCILASVWFVISVFIFNKAVRRYESSNLMTFGN